MMGCSLGLQRWVQKASGQAFSGHGEKQSNVRKLIFIHVGYLKKMVKSSVCEEDYCVGQP